MIEKIPWLIQGHIINMLSPFPYQYFIHDSSCDARKLAHFSSFTFLEDIRARI